MNEENERNETAAPEQPASENERLPGEVVEYYQLPEQREVVEYYFQPTPYPGRSARTAASPKKHRWRGLTIFLLCAAAVAGLTAAAYFLPVNGGKRKRVASSAEYALRRARCDQKSHSLLRRG